MDVFHAQDRVESIGSYWVWVGFEGVAAVLAFEVVSCAVPPPCSGHGVGHDGVGGGGGNGGSIFLVATVIIDVDLKLLTFCCSPSTAFSNPIMIIAILK